MFAYGYLTESFPSEDIIIEVSESRLREMLSLLIEKIEVDEKWYLLNNPDVNEAIKNKVFSSARDHYHTSGYFENRQPFPIKVDEIWYLNEYPDVQNAVSRGDFKNASEHFAVSGFKEGRRPRQGWALVKVAKK